jgi:hypothetical protein
MPAEWKVPDGILPEQLANVLLITVHPELLSKALLERITTVIAVGVSATETLAAFGEVVGQSLPPTDLGELESGDVLLWHRDQDGPPVRVKTYPCKMQRHRHRRKYAEGQLPPERSFYFHGPAGKMNLRAQNLMLFLQLGDGVDDETWDSHLRNGDYATWFRDSIKDDLLSAEAARIARIAGITPQESRKLIREAVEKDYTLPASAPMPVAGAS